MRALKQQPGKDLWLVGEGIPLFDGPYAPVGFIPAGSVELDCGTRVLTLNRRPDGAPGS